MAKTPTIATNVLIISGEQIAPLLAAMKISSEAMITTLEKEHFLPLLFEHNYG